MRNNLYRERFAVDTYRCGGLYLVFLVHIDRCGVIPVEKDADVIRQSLKQVAGGVGRVSTKSGKEVVDAALVARQLVVTLDVVTGADVYFGFALAY